MKTIKNNKLASNFKLLFNLRVTSWALYDFANQAFTIVIITIIFPVYFINIIVTPKLYPTNTGDLVWGLACGVSMLIASACSPVFGAIADSSKSKNKFLIFLSLACILFCSMLYFTGEGMLVRAVIIFMLANFFYQTSMMFYNSFLPEISTSKNTGIISGFGFAMGYLGGLLMLVLIYNFVKDGMKVENLSNIRLTFLFAAVFFLIFAIPSFIFLKDIPSKKEIKAKTSYIVLGFKKLSQTLKNIKRHPDLTRFLIAYFLFSNAFSVFALYVAIYARNTLGLELMEIIVLFIIGHFPVIVCSFFFGWLTDRIGPKLTVTITLIAWIIIIISVSFITVRVFFYFAYIMAAVVTGSTLIASRSLMTFLIPVDREAEFFGFYAISGKFSSILGPVVFGIVSFLTKSQSIALLTTLIFLVGGLVMIQFVKVPGYRPEKF
jgi:MFS transporter, UMF1 family